MSRPLPRVLIATGLVAVAPVMVVWTLRRAGVIDSRLLGAAIGAVLSLVVYNAAAEIWQRRSDSADVLFGDLMLWGWIRRSRQLRRIADARVQLNDLRRDATSLTPGRRLQLLRRLAHDLEARDPYTLGHSRRVARYSALIAKRLGIERAELNRIRIAAALHDIGKVRTPPEILRKPGALTDEEFAQIKRHPGDGAELVAILRDPKLTETVLRHHERLDGSGYPDGLRASEVPLGAQIIAVADTFDAVTSARPYRPARPHKLAFEILREEAGTKLDRAAAEAFISAYLNRRPLGLWIAFTDVADQVLSWISGGVAGYSSRFAALAAGTLAAGGGALVLPAAEPLAAASQIARIADTTRAAAPATQPAGQPVATVRLGAAPASEQGSSRRGGPHQNSRSGRGATPSSPAGPHAQGGGTRRTASPASHGSTTPSGTSAPGTSAAGTGDQGAATTDTGTSGSGAPSSDSGSGSGAGTPPSRSPGVTVGTQGGTTTVGVTAGSGPSAPTVAVTVGTGPGSVSAGVSASGGSGSPTVSAGVSAGSGAGDDGSSGVSAGVSAGSTSAGVSAGSSGVSVGVTVGPVSIKLGH